MNRSIQRIYRDLQEIKENPIPGISIIMPNENDPYSLISNIYIIEGIYKGIILHLLINLPENYPLKAPKMKIAPGQPFDSKFHHHIFGSIANGYSVCIDILDHGYFTEGAKTGWTPAYTLSTVLLQMQIFFSSQHDLHELPTTLMIFELKEKLKLLKVPITLTDGTIEYHSFNKPFPAIETLIPLTKINNNKFEGDINKIKAFKKMVCSISKTSIEESNFLVGFPIKKYCIEGHYVYEPILEIISYDSYQHQLLDEFKKGNNDMNNLKMRSSFGDEYNTWLPIFINDEYFKNNKTIIYNQISILKFGHKGLNKYDFNPDIIIPFFLEFFNSINVVFAFNLKFFEFLTCSIRLFFKLLDEFPKLLNDIHKYKEQNLNFFPFIMIFFENNKIEEINNIKLNFIKIFNRELMFQKSKTIFNFNFLEDQLITMYSNNKAFANIKTIVGFSYLKEREILNLYNEFLKPHFNFFMSLIFYNTKIFRSKEYFEEKMKKDYGILNEDEISEFVNSTKLEIEHLSRSIENLNNFFGINLIQQFSSYFRQIIVYRLIFNKDDEIQLDINFFNHIEHIIPLIQGFLELNDKNKRILEYMISNPNLFLKIERIIYFHDDISEIEKKRRLPQELFNLDENFLSSIYFLNYSYIKIYISIMCKNFFENNEENLKLLVIDEIKNMDIKIYEKIVLSFFTVFFKFKTDIFDDLINLNQANFMKMCYYIKIIKKINEENPNFANYFKNIQKIIDLNYNIENKLFFISFNVFISKLLNLEINSKSQLKSFVKLYFLKCLENHNKTKISKKKEILLDELILVVNNFYSSNSHNLINLYLIQKFFDFILNDQINFNSNMESNFFIISYDYYNKIINELSKYNTKTNLNIFSVIDFNCLDYNFKEIDFYLLEIINDEKLVFIPFDNCLEDYINSENSLFIAKNLFFNKKFEIKYFELESEKWLFKKLFENIIIKLKKINFNSKNFAIKKLDILDILYSIYYCDKLILKNPEFLELCSETLELFFNENKNTNFQKIDDCLYVLISKIFCSKYENENFFNNFNRRYIKFQIDFLIKEKNKKEVLSFEELKKCYELKWLFQEIRNNNNLIENKNIKIYYAFLFLKFQKINIEEILQIDNLNSIYDQIIKYESLNHFLILQNSENSILLVDEILNEIKFSDFYESIYFL